jgi:predicted TIM-barrel fold metal-dependent hydrolase
MSIFDEPKIDCHTHILDPVGFPYARDTHYRPAGQEIGTAAQLLHVMDAYGVRFALLVGPNSGYGSDNRCMLDAIARSAGRFKGVAVVGNEATRGELEALKAVGVVGVAWNVTHYGVDYYAGASRLLDELEALDLFVQIQVEHDQLVPLLPMLQRCGARILIDHCGRPTPEAGVDQPGFRALLGLATTRRAAVKLSGYVKFAGEPYPHPDIHPFLDALVDAYTPDACMWASDWPNLRAPGHMDYGLQLKFVERLFPEPADRHKVLWKTPNALFRFSA